MPLAHVLGVDHVVVTVRDLDAAAAAWRELGFTVSPRGLHSPAMGSANHTIMFGEDYIELLGIVAPTEINKPARDFLAKREGVERTAFTTDDAAAGAAAIAALGYPPLGPIHFGRPVPLPGGGEAEARFNVFRWPVSEAPGGMTIFACEHLTREAVWLPQLQQHANGARRLKRIEILTADPQAAAEHLGRLTAQPVSVVEDGWRVASGPGRAAFLFYGPAAFARLYPHDVRDGAPEEGVAALAVTTDALPAVAALPVAESHGSGVSVPARSANGVILRFEAC